MSKRCGYIALLGRPNAGKSTLLNACIGQKIVGVSKKPQTTRNKVLGIATEGESQFIFLDTPGIHNASGRSKLNQAMNKLAWSVIADADLICYLVDSCGGWTATDEAYLAGLIERSNKPILLIASKSDALKKEAIQKGIDEISAGVEALLEEMREDFPKQVELVQSNFPLPVASKNKNSVQRFKETAGFYLPESPWLFPEDDLTDKSQKFIAGELIREQLFRRLGAELPYACGVVIDSLEQKEKIVVIKATLMVGRASHKPMLIGKNGKSLKEIGSLARESLERHFEQKVFLQLYVKLAENWIDNDQLIAQVQELEGP